MTLEQLQAENEKLNGRLQKAITVFGEQKANIERVTAERDEARKQLTDAQTRISELEAKTQEATENDTKFFEQLEEINTLKEENMQMSTALTDANKKCEKLSNDIAKHIQAQDKLEDDKNALLTQIETERENHKKDNADFGTKIDELNARLAKASESYREQQDQITRLKDAYDKSQEMLAQLQDERNEENAKSASEIKALHDELDAQNSRISSMNDNQIAAKLRANDVKQQVAKIQELSNNLVSNFNIFE